MLRRSGERAALPPAPLSRARGRRGSRGSCCRPSATDKDGEQGGGGGKAAQPRELRRRPAHGEGSDGRKDARGAAGHRGGALLQRTDAPAQVYSGWPARVHAHTHRLTLTPSAPGSHARGFRESGRDLTPRHPTHTPTPGGSFPQLTRLPPPRLLPAWAVPPPPRAGPGAPIPSPRAGRPSLPPLTSSQTLTGLGEVGGWATRGTCLVSSRPDPRPPPRPLRALTSPRRLVPALLGGERGRRLYRPLKWLRERKGGERGGGASPRSAGSAVQSSRRRLADAPPRRKGRGRARSEAAAG